MNAARAAAERQPNERIFFPPVVSADRLRAAIGAQRFLQPWRTLLHACLPFGDGLCMFEAHADVVEPLQKARSIRFRNLEMDVRSARPGDRLSPKINGEGRIAIAG